MVDFQTGMSGLLATSKQLNTVGNNIANSSTVGYKRSSASFGDMYASGLSNVPGMGVSAGNIGQDFSQGGTKATNNNLDLTIAGAGFFKMAKADPNYPQDSTRQTYSYTRDGQFHLSTDGYIINSDGLRLQGVNFIDTNTGATKTTANGQTINSKNPSISNLPVDSIRIPVDAPATQKTSQVNIAVNLDNRATAIPTPAVDITDPRTYTTSTTQPVYDSLGNEHKLNLYFVKTDTATNKWKVYGDLDGNNPGGAASTNPTLFGDMVFNSDGTLNTNPATSTILNNATGPLSSGAGWTGFTLTNGAGSMLTSATNTDGSVATYPWLNFSGSTQQAYGSSVNTFTQDGLPPGSLTDIKVSDQGVIIGKYSNGLERDLGMLKLADFRDPTALQSIGNNQWAATGASGQPIENFVGAAGTGTILSKTVEQSNVELTNELVDLIALQRQYQANSQTISAQSSTLQTLVNLR